MDIIQEPLRLSPKYQTAISDFCNEYRQQTSLMQELQALIEIHPAVQAGDYIRRQISEHGSNFCFELGDDVDGIHDVIAWSRILADKEIVCAVNLHPLREAVVYVTIDEGLHLHDAKMHRLFGPNPAPPELNVEQRNGKAIRLTIPARTLVIYN